MRKALFVTCAAFLMGSVGRAQYFQFSQSNFTDTRINPAVVATSDYAVMNAVFRNQRTGGDFNLNSSFVSAAYPLMHGTRNRWAGLGISLLDDRSGGMFNIQEASLSYAANLYLSTTQSVAFGARGMFRQQKIDAAGLTTGAQYIPDRGFDEGVFNGENFDELQQTFFTLSFGAHWQQVDRTGERIAYASLSFFDFNKPEDSFLGTASRLRETVVGALGFRMYQGREASIFPEVIYSSTYGHQSLIVGAVTRLSVKPSANMPGGHLDILTKIATGRGAIAGLQLHRDNFSVGFTYDFPLFERNPSNLGAVEVGLQLRRLVTPSPRRPMKLKGKDAKGRKSNPKAGRSEIKVVDEAPDNPMLAASDSVEEKESGKARDTIATRASVGTLSHEPVAFEKTTLQFRFSLNSVALDNETRSYLNGLAEVLMENRNLKLRIVGHTDNSGTAAYNERLSLERANAVRNYLLRLGIESVRITTDGRGMREPLNNNSTAEERSVNRRVELILEFQP